MAMDHEDLDQFSANESIGFFGKRGRSRVALHVASVECRETGDHPQQSHRTRTKPVRPQQ
jgi:hypothetical protein